MRAPLDTKTHLKINAKLTNKIITKQKTNHPIFNYLFYFINIYNSYIYLTVFFIFIEIPFRKQKIISAKHESDIPCPSKTFPPHKTHTPATSLTPRPQTLPRQKNRPPNPKLPRPRRHQSPAPRTGGGLSLLRFSLSERLRTRRRGSRNIYP